MATITVYSNPRGRQSSSYIAPTHEYLLVVGKSSEGSLAGEPLTDEQKREFRHRDALGVYREIGLRLRGGRATAAESPTLHYCRHVTDRSDLIFAEALGIAHAWEDIELYYAQTVKTDFSRSDSDDEEE